MATITDRYILEIDTQGSVRNLGAASSSLGSLGGALTRIGPLAGAAAGALAAVGAVNLVGNVVEATAAYQDMFTTLETVTGSAKAANDAMSFIQEFATQTPFAIDELTSTFIALKNAGIEPTRELLTSMGDAAAVSSDKVGALQAITDLFSRSVQGGLGVEDLDRLADRGINVYGILREQLGLTRNEISEYGKTAEGAAEIQAALLEGFNQDYGGGMERAAANLSTSLSNLGIAANNTLIAIGQGGLADGINHAALAMTELLGTNSELATALGAGLGEIITRLTDYFMEMAPAIIEALVPAFEGLMSVIDALSPVLRLLGTIFTEILVPILTTFFEIVGAVADALAPFIDAFVSLVEVGLRPVGIALEVITGLFSGVIEVISSIIEWVGNLVNSFVQGFAAIGNAIYDGISAPITYVKDSFAGLWDYLWGNSVAEDIVNTTIEGFRDMGDGMVEGVEGVDGKISGIFNNIYNTVVTGLGSAVQSAVDGVKNAFASVTGWLGGLFGGTEDSANAAGDAINNAVTQNLDTVQLDKANESLSRMNEIVAAQTETIAAHAQTLRDTNDAFIAYNDVQSNINESLTAIATTRETLNDLQNTELEYYKGVNTELETYVEYLTAETEQFTSKVDLYQQMIEHYATITESINNLNTAYGDAQANVETAIEKDGEFTESLGKLSTQLTDVVSNAFTAHIEGLTGIIAKTQETTTATDNLIQSMNSLASASQAAQSAATSAMSSINSAINSAKQLQAQQASTGGFNFNNPFAGFFANGGTIPGGSYGVVGEAGPELVQGPATVTPLDTVGSSSNVTYNINAVDAQSFKALLARDPEYLHAVVQRGSKRFTGRR